MQVPFIACGHHGPLSIGVPPLCLCVQPYLVPNNILLPGPFLFNYVDNFIGAEKGQQAWDSFHTVLDMFSRVGVDIADDKTVPPSPVIECLGTWLNAKEMTISITQDRLNELVQELETWLGKTQFNHKDLVSLIGKLQFVCKCVRPGRVFLARLINKLRGGKEGPFKVTEQI